jgi:hypothetical protein
MSIFIRRRRRRRRRHHHHQQRRRQLQSMNQFACSITIGITVYLTLAF